MAYDPVITTHPSTVIVPRGENTTLTVAATGTEPLTYFWQKNGAFIEGANETTLAVTNVQASDRYRCLVVASTVGATMSNEALVLVNESVTVRGGVGEYDEIADLLASGETTWALAFVRNWVLGDGIKTYWAEVDDDALVANGTDILETAGGRIVWRLATRQVVEGEPVVPAPEGATFSMSRPIVFATLADFRASTVDAVLVFLLADANDEFSQWERTAGPETDDGVNFVQNASLLWYRRIVA